MNEATPIVRVPLSASMLDATLNGRFLEKVEKSDGCWIWRGALDGYGYGLFRVGRTIHRSHRVAWCMFRGDIPRGTLVLHNCPSGDNPSCVNPAHLWLGTMLDNIRDMEKKGRRATGDKVRHLSYPRGDEHFRAKLKESYIPEIRRLACGGVSFREIGRRFGVHHGTISMVVRGITWWHIN